MAKSKCPKCSGESFELVEGEAKGSDYKFYFVQCSSCGTVVSTHEYVHIGTQLDEIKKLIKP